MDANYQKLILEDDVYLAANQFVSERTVYPTSNWTDAQKIHRKYRNALVLNGDCVLSKLAIEALSKNVGKHLNSLFVWGTGGKTNPYEEEDSVHAKPLGDLRELPNDSCVFLFADATQLDAASLWLQNAEAVFERVAALRNARCIVCAIVPEMKALPKGIANISEREYDYMLENNPAKTASETFMLDIQSLCRKAVQTLGVDVSLLRVANLFGPGTADDRSGIQAMIRRALSDGRVDIVDADFRDVRSFTYTVDAVHAAFWLLWHGKGGHEYQYATKNGTLAEVKQLIRNVFPQKLALSCNCEANGAVSYACLNPQKFNCTKFKSVYHFSKWIARMVCYVADCPYPNIENKRIYAGKLDQIKSMEMRILRAVDEICVRHGLKYFIAAGSLLGARRYGHNIPWDDDLDIAFLRRDFEIFRKVCEKELPPELVHCSWYNGTNSHYPVDKIRFRDTYFSTNYSSINTIQDGVFLDILVYDATSDIAPIAWIHNKALGIYSWFLLQILWRDPPRRNFRSLPSYLFYKTIRILPIGFYHWVFERLLTAFRFKRRPKFLVDGTGARAGIKKIPAAGLFDVKRIPFDEGFAAPCPIDEEDYLVFAYGNNYLKEPPLSEQHGHSLARIDLGKYLFDPDPARKGRPADIRGELFEE